MTATDRAAALELAAAVVIAVGNGDRLTFGDKDKTFAMVCEHLLAAEAERERLAAVDVALSAAHRKIAAVRVIVEDFWTRKNAGQAYDRDTAWAAHVALVQLERVLRRSGADKALIERLAATTDTERHDG